MAAEIADLQSVLDELWERVDELKEAAASSSSTKSALKAAFAQMAAAGPASSSPPSPSAGVLSAAPISLFLLIFYLLPAPNVHLILVNCHSKGSNVLVNSPAFSTYKSGSSGCWLIIDGNLNIAHARGKTARLLQRSCTAQRVPSTDAAVMQQVICKKLVACCHMFISVKPSAMHLQSCLTAFLQARLQLISQARSMVWHQQQLPMAAQKLPLVPRQHQTAQLQQQLPSVAQQHLLEVGLQLEKGVCRI